jgi:four helix bundle protein
MKNNVIVDKSFAFAVRAVKAYQYLTQERKEYVLSRQFLRSGTAIDANVEEAIGAQSQADFLSKMSIAYKEARETRYWIRLLEATEYFTEKQTNDLLQDVDRATQDNFQHQNYHAE